LTSKGPQQRKTARIDDALADVLHPGQDIVIGQGWGAPQELIDALPRHADRLAGSRIFVGLLLEAFPMLPATQVETFFPSGPLGSVAGLRRHGATYARSSLFELARAFRTGSRPVDVVLAQASLTPLAPVSVGVTVDYLHAAAARAQAVVLQAGAGVPWTGVDSTIERDSVVLVESDAAPQTLARSATPRDAAIAAHVAEWIPDGATLQLGMAPWVEPLVELLRHRRGLRVHSGLISDWVAELHAAGALDRSMPVTATGAGGSPAFYRWLDRAECAELRPADWTHAPETLAELPLLRTVNSVLEMDLRGNVNSEIGHRGRRGGVAGLHDFAVAAAGRTDSLSIVAFPATVNAETRIVPRLEDHAVSLPPGSVDLVVTEYGAADLRDGSPAERAEALVRVAAPQHRERLRAALGDESARPIEV
jgi:acetyl-CoA hydrolase